MKTFWKREAYWCREWGRACLWRSRNWQFQKDWLAGEGYSLCTSSGRWRKCLSCWEGCSTTGQLKLASSSLWIGAEKLHPQIPSESVELSIRLCLTFSDIFIKWKARKRTILHTTGTIWFNGSTSCLCERGNIEEKQLQYWIVYNIIKTQGIEQAGGHYRTITQSKGALL